MADFLHIFTYNCTVQTLFSARAIRHRRDVL